MATAIRLPALLAASLLAACATTRAPAPPTLDPDAQRALLQRLERIELGGRVAGAVANEGFSAQLGLKLQGERADLDLRAPLGFGSASVAIDGERFEFSSSRGERLAGDAAQAALMLRLGFEPPVRSLRYWLLGVPDPSAPSQPLADASGFEQAGWRITTADRVTTTVRSPAAGVAVPKRVTLERSPVRLRVLLERWNLST